MATMKPVTEKGLQVLNFLQADPDGNYTAADIAEKLGYTTKTVDGVVTSGLVKNKNLVERVEAEVELPDGTHKGIKLIKLTPAGEAYNHDAVTAEYEASVAAEKAAKAAE